MRKVFIVVLLLLNFHSYCQKYDTIYVNTEGTTYLIFDEPITMFNLGSKDYEAKADNPRILFIRAKTTLVKRSTLVVTHGDEIYTAYIAFKMNAQAFYDFRKKKLLKEEAVENIEQKKIENKLNNISKLPKNVNIVAKKQQIELNLLNLYNDNEATFLRFSLKNQSSIIYDLDYVSFAYIEKSKRTSKKINSLNGGLQEVEPLIKVEKLLTESGKSNEYLYALPLYSTTEDGFLQVIFREKAGLRSITINIPFKKILRAELF
jgi:Domain of unknown function (DUF4138)